MININQTSPNVFSAAEVMMCSKFLNEFRKRCKELDSTSQVTSRSMPTQTGEEYQIEVYEGGKPSGLYRIFRSMASGKLTFTRVYT